jgi:Na+-transporting methylmalonyl-CoA/oxaloacetate decarboxylase beta subunit
LIGGADGPMVLFTSLKLAPEYFVPITVIGYLYLSLTYAGYPFLIKWLVPKKLRGTAMNPLAIRKIPPAEKVVFAVVALAILCLMFPVAGPLFVCFFVGLVIKEMNVVKIREFLEGPLLYGSTFFLGLILGSLVSADIISDPVVFKLLVLGVVSLTLAALGGIGAGLLHNKISHGKANPLLGLAAVSCVPTCAKIAQKEASKANKFAMILPYAMGPNVAGVITTAIIAGIYISLIPLIK